MFFILVHVAVITAWRVHRQWHLYNITLLQTTGVLHIASSYSLHSYKMGSCTPILLLTKALVILLLYCLSDVHGITEYYIKPTEFDNVSCPREPCHTLNYFASSTHNTWSGVVWRFCLATIA